MNSTQIEWVKNPDGSQGYTWNPITGCLNHDNGLCKGGGFPCYAYRLANGRLKPLYLANTHTVMQFSDGYQEMHLNVTQPFHPRFWEDRLYKPVNKIRRWGKQSQVVHRQEPKGIFVCDMGDLFGIGIPEEWTRKVLDRFQYCPQHRFYLLTKQPQRLPEFSPFPDNAWVGVTATGRASLKAACYHLAEIQAKVKYISLEPLLEEPPTGTLLAGTEWHFADWLIIGACTGAMAQMSSLVGRYFNLTLTHWKGNLWTAQPEIEALQEIVEAADKAGIKVFLKDNVLDLVNYHARDTDFAFKGGYYRQDIPEG